MEEQALKASLIMNEVKKVVIGKDDIIYKVLTTILAKGHILIEDIPGVGKTTLALAFSKAMDLDYHRMQFTPDVLPSDVIGFHIFNKEGGGKVFQAGSVICNMFLADEINRTSSKTQSALLEVMEEGSVTVDSITYEVPKPFIVIATQNPIGSVGTQMLPESQLDRFMVKLNMGYPDMDSEVQILKGRQLKEPLLYVEKVVSKEEILKMQQYVEKVVIHDAIYEYIAKLAIKTRELELIALGVSPRGTLAITSMAKANAFLQGRHFVIPDDVKSVFREVVAHRILLQPKAKVNHITIDDLINNILNMVPAPKLMSKPTGLSMFY